MVSTQIFSTEPQRAGTYVTRKIETGSASIGSVLGWFEWPASQPASRVSRLVGRRMTVKDIGVVLCCVGTENSELHARPDETSPVFVRRRWPSQLLMVVKLIQRFLRLYNVQYL